ncbi:MAG: class IV adenylate cyclase [Planctomycetota bacterium]
MARNVEIKAILSDLRAAAALSRALTGHDPERIHQRDTFFMAKKGRLKLRELDDRSELIQYERPDQTGPKTSNYTIVRVAKSETAAMRLALSRALGISGEVIKTRDLYLHGRTRIHLDRVEGLGDFLELEVVLKKGESESEGQREAEALMIKLGVTAADLLEGAYVDLIATQAVALPESPPEKSESAAGDLAF